MISKIGDTLLSLQSKIRRYNDMFWCKQDYHGAEL